MTPIFLHLGAGTRKLPGFINIDIEPGADMQLDLTQSLPWDDRSVDGIFSEHFIEHISQADAIRLLRECRRILVPGGVVRIATPDLQEMVRDYAEQRIHPDWEKFGLGWTANRCERFNIGMRWWGHQWMYDEEELTRLARMVGLEVRRRCLIGESDLPMFRNLEYRESSTLILELEKPKRQLTADALPLVSITIPSYRPRFFEAALQSALRQTYPNTEIVICDDCPDDGIARILDKYSASHPRLRYFRNSERLNRQNLVKCADVAQGEFIKFLNDDDLLAPNCIERMIECFKTLPDITLVTSKRTRIDESGRILPEIFETLPVVREDAIIEGLTLGAALLSSFRNFVGEPTTAMFRKADVAHLKPDYLAVDNHMVYGINDIAVWTNLAIQGNAVYLVEPLSQFRIHSSQSQAELRDEVFAGAVEGIKIMRASWDRRGLSRGQYFGTVLWKPVRNPQGEWQVRTIVEDFSGWKDVIPDGKRSGEIPEGVTAEADPGSNRVRAEPENAAPPSRPGSSALDERSYRRWMDCKSLDQLDARLFQEHASKLWKTRQLFEFCLVLEPGREPLLADSIDAISQQYYDGWRLTIFASTPSPEAEFTREGSTVRWIQLPDDAAPAEAINAHLIQSAANWIGFFECGARFAPQLLLSLSDYLAIHPEWRLVYTDEDTIDEEGNRQSPLFKPDFNLELLRSADYIGSLFVERNALLAAGGYAKNAEATYLDIALRVADALGDPALGHIPDVLLHIPTAAFRRASEGGAAQALREHLGRRSIDADVFQGLAEGATRRILYRHPATPMVSIIIPTRNCLELLRPCVASLFEQTSYPEWELLLVDNGSDAPAVIDYYNELRSQHPGRVRLLHFDAPFNFSAMNNMAARQAQGEYLLFLNNDTECIHNDWLDAMMSHAQRPDVGIVGARLLFPDSLKIQHAGVVLGMTGTANHVDIGALSPDDPGYMNRALADQEYSAVTGACMLIRKSVFDEIGGLDEEAFRISFNDIDLCLKTKQRGYRIIWTPFATLLHHGSATQAMEAHDPIKVATFQNECNEFYSRWTGKLVDDPAWNRNLSLNATTPTIEDELVAPWNTDFHDRPRILVMPVLAHGAAEYRNLTPLRHLHAAGKVQFASVCQPRGDFERAPMPIELERLAPDTLVMHAPVDNVRGQALLRYQRFNPGIFRVYALDDLITNIPESNPTYSTLPAGTIAERLTLGLRASDRLLVSTEPLVDAYRHLIDDIRLVPNSLPWSIWGELRSQRRNGKKPRVGWAGAQQHAGDLRFLEEVINATSHEIDWIFFGMMPQGSRPLIAEFHDYVHDFSAYPAKLASLDLDLAIAPLEIHPFNEAKSNLRLLEYGILGWPVICTDILPYRTDNPPVSRLPNDAAKWIEAIRERVADRDALAREGDALREWVKRHYLLENRLDEWLSAFLR